MTLFLTKNYYFRTKHSCMDETLFSQFVLCHASNNTTFRNIGGRVHGPSSPQNVWGIVPLVPPKSPPVDSCISKHLRVSEPRLRLIATDKYSPLSIRQ